MKFAIIILVQQSTENIAYWEVGACFTFYERPATKALSLIPTEVQEITILLDNTISGSLPLVLRFQDVFLRPAVLSEGDITFTAEDLSEWADTSGTRMTATDGYWANISVELGVYWVQRSSLGAAEFAFDWGFQ
jgi:hypothetical protein